MTAQPMDATLPVVVIGGGPVALAAAAHLLEQGLEPLVLERGPAVGAAISQWGHVRLFSPWAYDIDAAAARLLAPTGWQRPADGGLPTGAELVEQYLAPLAATDALASRIRTGTTVTVVSRQGMDKTRTIGRERRPYLVRTVTTDGQVEDVLAAAVIDASGTWGHANPLGASGLPAHGEDTAAPWIAPALPDVLGRDRARFAGKRVLVVGMGHSAASTLLALVKLREEESATTITWAIRGRSPARLFGGGSGDGLPARGALGSHLKGAVRSGSIVLQKEFTITALTAPDYPAGMLTVSGAGRDGDQSFEVDVLVGATGFRPDLAMLREVRLDLDPGVEAPARLASLIDPNFHSCGTVPPHGARMLAHPDENFYLAGSKSYGRAPTFLLATGYEQVRSIAAALAGDHEAAERVELLLPETGVCSSNPAAFDDAARGFTTGSEHGWSGEQLLVVSAPTAACCGTPASEDEDELASSRQ
ncbi:MAG: NAD(P)-binding domain-containing protein [Nakamurella sp.]